MNESWEEGFRKLARIDELPEGKPKIYRTGGEAVVLLREGLNVRAVDATQCVPDNLEPRQRLRAALDCLGADDWRTVMESKPLQVRIDKGDIWVCVE